MQPTWSAQSAYSSAASDGEGLSAQPMLLTPETTPSDSPLERTRRLPVQDESHSHSQQQTSWPSSTSPSSTTTTTTPPHQHGPSTTASDRLIRDEVAPFQILSRDLRAVRADGRVELGRGDGFTERELVRQMPSVWRVSGVPTLDDVEGSLGALGVREEKEEEERAREREEEERKRLERKRELMEIARNGWDLDDEDLLLMASSLAGQGSKDTLGRSTATNGTTADQPTPKALGSLATVAAAASPSARQKEDEARRRRREEGSARQRALSTSATLGRRSVSSSGPSPASPAAPAAAVPSTGKGPSTPSPATVAGRRSSGGLPSSSKTSGHAPPSTQKSVPPSAMSSSRSESTLARTVDRSKLSPGGAGGAGAGSDEDGSNSIRLSLYGEDAVPPMADDKPTKDELMNWDSVVIPGPSSPSLFCLLQSPLLIIRLHWHGKSAVRKKKKHNPLLEWDDSISNPSTTPPSKAKTREPYTPPATAPPPPPTLSFGEEGKAKEGEEDDWPPPAPGTFGYKPPKERTPTTSTSVPPAGLTTGSVLQDKVDPANAGFASGSAGGDGTEASAMGSPTPSSTNFENVNGHRYVVLPLPSCVEDTYHSLQLN